MLTATRTRSRDDDMARVKRNDVAVKLGADVVKMARHLAVDRGIPLAQYLTDRIRPLVEEDFGEYAKGIKSPKRGGREVKDQ